MSLSTEINKRRTFAIIAHPDAGKTTLTEKLLLFGGAIQTAGAVKSNKIDTATKSDWMEIEKQRGISVATSVMGFEYKDIKINLLDTPGHQDFAEDTYRTLTAVDSVIMVIDCVKGVEIQTEKLMEVCLMRKTPVICFINKLDREGRDPYDLLDEVEAKLKIKVRPLSWPIGMGKGFKGVYNLYEKKLNLFTPSQRKLSDDRQVFENLDDPQLDGLIGPGNAKQLREDVDLIEGVYPDFEVNDYLEGKIAPVFFGSAVNNFGVNEMLDTFIQIAPIPQSRETDIRKVAPEESKFSGFVFKIHANMDPNHRNRIAFLRICSGKFERNKPVGQLQFEVIQFRLKNEYNATVAFQPMNLYKACWISCADKKQLDEFVRSKNRYIARDKDDKLVFMAESKSWLQMVQDNYPEIEFHFTSEF